MKYSRSTPLLDRFYSRIVEGANGCQLWTGGKIPDGYGMLRVNGISTLTHRLAWELAFGPIPADMNVLHKCDNPPCVNPDHLFLGTQADNMRDCKEKGRGKQYLPGDHWIRGADHPFARLTQTQVDEIRAAYKQGGVTQSGLADIYGVSQTTISRIILQRRYRDKLGLGAPVFIDPTMPTLWKLIETGDNDGAQA